MLKRNTRAVEEDAGAALWTVDEAVLEAEQTRLVSKNAKIGLVGNTVNGLVLLAVLEGQPIPLLWGALWFFALFVSSLMRMQLASKYQEYAAKSEVGRWRRQFAVLTGVSGALWGATSVAFFLNPSPFQGLIIVILMAGMSAGAVGANGSDPKILKSFNAPLLAPFALAFFAKGTGLAIVIGLLTIFFYVMLNKAAQSVQEAIRRTVALNQANKDLVDELKGTVDDLTESRAELGIIADYSYAWETWFGSDNKPLWISPSVHRISGYTADECMAMDDYPLPLIHEEDREFVSKALKRAHKEASQGSIVFRILRKDGELRWCGAESMPAVDKDGRARGFRSSLSDVTERVTMRKKLEKMATTDPLTGVANRRKLMDQLEKEAYRARRYSIPMSTASFDIDYFKVLNDTYGHSAGDKCLKRFSDLVEERIRKSDLFARVGGEEFILLLPETTVNDAMTLCERIRKDVANELIQHDGQSIRFTVSGGLIQLSGAHETVDAMLANVDEALYKAKDAGRNRIVIADEATSGTVGQPFETSNIEANGRQ